MKAPRIARIAYTQPVDDHSERRAILYLFIRTYAMRLTRHSRQSLPAVTFQSVDGNIRHDPSISFRIRSVWREEATRGEAWKD